MHNLNLLQNEINYYFKDENLLLLSLTHPSYANEHNKCQTNQRLEFLGDAVLELVSSDFLYKNFNDYNEGKLTKIRANLVCENSLSKVARDIKLYNYLLIGNGENADQIKNNNSIMCDTIEALIGAIYLDSDIDEASKFIKKYILTNDNMIFRKDDYKSIIQEIANRDKVTLQYELVKEYGPDHDKSFIIKINYDNKIIEEGFGKSKKEAEQDAARLALNKIV